MIEKERLEELIKQGATIWGVVDYTYHSSKPYKRIEYWDLGNMPTFYIDEFYETNWNAEFFETKEDAEFALKYQNITRTETLSLPTWEEVQRDLEKRTDGDYVIVDNERVTFIYYKPSGFEVISNCDNYNFGPTKDNYTEACEICRKLFLGEKV